MVDIARESTSDRSEFRTLAFVLMAAASRSWPEERALSMQVSSRRQRGMYLSLRDPGLNHLVEGRRGNRWSQLAQSRGSSERLRSEEWRDIDVGRERITSK